MIEICKADIAAKIINDRFCGIGSQQSIANGLLMLIRSDSKSTLEFANALVEATQEFIGKSVPMYEFSLIAKKVFDSVPMLERSEVGKVNSYESLKKETGINIIPLPEEPEENPLPYSAKKEIRKFFIYDDVKKITQGLKALRVKYKVSEANLINLVESLSISYKWIVNNQQIKNFDLEKLVEIGYNKNKVKYKW